MLSDSLSEIMHLPLSYGGKRFFHGTPSADSARKIFDDKYLRYQPRKFSSTPVDKVYLTTDLGYALKYALELTGSGKYGYIFTVGVEDLLDILPDEDDVGRLVQKTYDIKFKDGKNPPNEDWIFLEYRNQMLDV